MTTFIARASRIFLAFFELLRHNFRFLVSDFLRISKLKLHYYYLHHDCIFLNSVKVFPLTFYHLVESRNSRVFFLFFFSLRDFVEISRCSCIMMEIFYNFIISLYSIIIPIPYFGWAWFLGIFQAIITPLLVASRFAFFLYF